MALAALAAVLLWVGCSWIPHERLSARVLATPSQVYGRPLVLAPGLRVSTEALADHLDRTGYRARPEGALAPGEYRLGAGRLEVARRPFRYPDGPDPGGLASVELVGGRVTAVRAPDGEPAAVLLEPERVGTLFGDETEDRIAVPLARIPAHVRDAVIVTEDRRFRWHPGVDPVRVVGAALANARAGRIVEGGSTLTQQLVKNVYLSGERTFRRKLRETVRALALELRHSKDEILEAYLHQVYLGQDGARAIHGVGRAARFYFGKEVEELGVAEAALLAGLIQAPSALSPFRHPERALARRNAVLDRLRAHGRIDEATHAVARAAPLGVRREAPQPRFAADFVELVRARLEERLGAERLERDGLAVFTTLDGAFQRDAERAVREGLRELERGYPLLRRRASPLQAALVALDPTTGDVLALVGGRDEASSFDRATHARRQPGSLMKPVVALAALTAPASPPFTLATILEDRPLRLEVEGRTWSPRNDDGRHLGPVTLRRALEDSRNVPFARLGLEVGLVHVAETARRMGIESPLRPIPSLSLGAFEVTPLEVASAYAVLASGGLRPERRTTLAVVRPDGRTVAGDPVRRRRAFGPEPAYLVTSALEGAVERGTARSLRRLGVGGPVAGKTGTTNGARDAWFVGYTPDLVVAVWVGFDDGARVGLPGARAALPIFARFVRGALGDAALREVPVPAGLETVEVDPATGLRAGERCPGRPERFVAGTAPRQRACADAGPLDWLRRVFGG